MAKSNTEKNNEQGNTVNIGKKPTGVYVLAVATAMKNGDITIQARGNAISSAVSVALVSMQRLDLKQKNINIATESVDFKKRNEQGDETGETTKGNISTIKIILGK